MSRSIPVATAGFAMAASPDSLTTLGIGSCVAVCLYDPKLKLGGLAHIMLPRNTANDQGAAGKYADTAISGLIRLMAGAGASQKCLTAKIAGGARMFASAAKPAITVGKNNIEAVKKVLAENHIPVIAADTGGSHGRGLVFRTETGAVEVTVLASPPKTVVL